MFWTRKEPTNPDLYRRIAELEADVSALRRDVADVDERVSKYRRSDVREARAVGAVPVPVGPRDRVHERRMRRLALREANGHEDQ